MRLFRIALLLRLAAAIRNAAALSAIRAAFLTVSGPPEPRDNSLPSHHRPIISQFRGDINQNGESDVTVQPYA